jgi:hypothetical protein
VSHQTVRLARGKHETPDNGVCVMELVSMLAHERFSDHPRCASPVIADFLRTYNDLLTDRRRQDLVRYATRVAGTRRSDRTERMRDLECGRWTAAVVAGSGWLWRRRFRAALRSMPVPETAGMAAARIAAATVARSGDRAHRSALALVDRLIELDAGRGRERLALPKVRPLAGQPA